VLRRNPERSYTDRDRFSKLSHEKKKKSVGNAIGRMETGTIEEVDRRAYPL